MKPLAPEELIELLSPDPAMVDAALQNFEIAAPVLCRDAGYCRQLVAEGWTEPTQINWYGRPAFVIAWHVTPDGGFWLDIAQTLSSGAPFEVLVRAVERLARENACRYIRFLTMRPGLVHLGQLNGYIPEAALLTKVL